MSDRIYLDHHATTPVDPRVLERMLPYFTTKFGNPGSIGHVFGEEAKAAVDQARTALAATLGVQPGEIVFTSGATESNNLALRGVAARYRDQGGHFVSVTTEHKAVLDPLARLQRQGFDVTLLPVAQHDAEFAGLVDPQRFRETLRADTRLASVMLVNNEIGVVQPISELAELCHEHGTLLHCDATQAVGKLPIDWDALGADLVSFSGHKLYGPRGIGVLIVRRRRPRIKLLPQIEGGGQEHGLRSGTLNVPAIVGLAEAVRLAAAEMNEEMARLRGLRERLWTGISAKLEEATLNGPGGDNRVAGNLNVRFRGVDGEALMLHMPHIAVSSGSACTSANPEPSHVLRAMGLSEDATRSSIRFGLGRFTTADEVDTTISTVVEIVRRLRSI